jgi:hypothetical protein
MRIRVRRVLPLALLPALLLAVVSVTPALGAPTWGIEMTHANAYGLQAASCPGGHESLPGEPDCGVDPFTGSGTTFSQESGFNTYTITVKNTAAPAAGPAAGDTLTCGSGTWEESPTFTYHWLRNGTVIAGTENDEYTLVAADEGKSVQCEVVATNVSGVAVAMTNAVAVSPPQSTTLPTLEPGSKVHVPREASTFPVGETLECEHESWSGNPTFSYHWLRNGTTISGAESSDYTLAAGDAGTSVQCQVIATNAGGSVVAENPYFTYVGTKEPEPYPPYFNEGPKIPTGGSAANETSGPVTVADQLSEGLVLAGNSSGDPAASGSGWECTVTSSAEGVSCTSSRALAPGESDTPITLHVRVGGEAALGTPPNGGVTNTAAVSGGGAASVLTSDPTTITSAVPFGIASFTTSVIESLGNPFTRAGGHPFAANATFVFDETPEFLGALWTAGGSPKDIETELPAGFIGNPQNAAKCTAVQLEAGTSECPAGSAVGFVTLTVGVARIEDGKANPFVEAPTKTLLVYNLQPTPGSPASFGFVYRGSFFALNASVRSNGDYGVTIGDSHTGREPAGLHGVQALSLTFCSYGTTGYGSEGIHFGQPATAACAAPAAGAKPLLTDPTRCEGPAPTTTLRADTYEDPADYVSKTVYNGTNLAGDAPSATESFVTGCNALAYSPEVELKPSSATEGGTSQADEPTGATFSLKVPQTSEVGVDATPELKNATVTLPEGMTADPSAADGLQGCSNAQFGLGSTHEPAEPASCPLASQIGTVRIVTPLLEKPLEGQVFLGEPACSPCSSTDAQDGHLFRLFLQVRSVERGVIVKLAGKVSANPATGRLQATFTQQPQLPFSELILTFNGGVRAPLANPQTCGTFTTTTDLTPWSAPGLGGLSGSESIVGTPDATPSSSFDVTGCGASMGFAPSFSAGSQVPIAGASGSFSVMIGREDREQDISGVSVSIPPGLLGEVSQVSRCPEAQANAGTCGPESEIGTTTVGAGPGSHPFYLGGKVYLTGPYKGQPFGLSIVVPAVAGPFNLGTVVVRAAIAVNPSTAALTIASDPLPQYVDGVQLRLRKINVEVNRPGFVLNPTSCAQESVGAMITATQGASSSVSSPFAVGACQNLAFAPELSATTQANTSKAKGASLTVTVKSPPGQANIAKVDLELPKALPARLTTLQKACTEAQFTTNPAGCPAASDIGTATAITPVLNAPLTGPAYLVSHGGAAFPDVEFVLQGEGITIDLDGQTDIKRGITYSRFETIPDAPISNFTTVLPEGPHSVLATDIPASAKGSMCGQALSIPTIITAQNGKQIKQTTKITVTDCKTAKSLTRAQKLAKALKACKKLKGKQKRALCEAEARKKYGPKTKGKKSTHGKERK